MTDQTGAQDPGDANSQQVSIPSSDAVVAQQMMGATLPPDDDDVSPEQLAAMEQAFFNPAPAEVVSAQPVPQSDEEFPQYRLRGRDALEDQFLRTVRSGAQPPAATAEVYGTQAAATAPAVEAPAAAAPAAPAPTPEPAPAGPAPEALAAEALQRVSDEVLTLAANFAKAPWDEQLGLDLEKKRVELTLAAARAETANMEARYRAEVAAQTQYEELCRELPGWDQLNSKVGLTRAEVMRDLKDAGDPRLNSPDWQRHVANVVRARMGPQQPPTAPLPQAAHGYPVAQFTPPASAGGAPTAPVRMLTADQLEEMEDQEPGTLQAMFQGHQPSRVRVIG